MTTVKERLPLTKIKKEENVFMCITSIMKLINIIEDEKPTFIFTIHYKPYHYNYFLHHYLKVIAVTTTVFCGSMFSL